jgi:hypothetical protein
MSENLHIIEMQFEENEAEYLKVFIYVSLHLLCSQYSVNLRKNTRGLSYFLKQINLHTKTQVNEAMSIYSSLTSTQISKDIWDSKTFKFGVEGSGSLILRGNALRMIFRI